MSKKEAALKVMELPRHVKIELRHWPTLLGMCTYRIVICIVMQDQFLQHLQVPPRATTEDRFRSGMLRPSWTPHAPVHLWELKLDLLALGTLLEISRTGMGLSARETAERAGISPAYLRAIELGQNPKTGKPSRPSAEALLGLAAALEVDPVELLTLADYSPELASRTRPRGESLLANRSPDDLARRIQDAVRSLYKVTPFLQEVAQEQLAKFAAEINLLASGTFRCSAEEEPFFTKLAVRRCKYNLKAVSFQDLEWWRDDQGAEYLQDHRVLKAQDVEMTRIFVAPRSEWRRFQETFVAHLEIGIHTLVVDQETVAATPIRDFVVYDDSLLRTASVVLDDESSSKTAEFTDVEAHVTDAIADFMHLLRRAQPVEEVLARWGEAEDE